MNKAEFISMVAAKAGTSKKDSDANLDAILAVITENLAKGEDVPFIGFGTFKVVERPERTGRNPGTGASIKIPATKAVTFKVGAKLKEAVIGKKTK
jgi:DNA-binding protein HU-beta